MAKRSEAAAYVLNKFSLGEIQSSYVLPRVRRFKDEHGRTVTRTVQNRITGTGIPASTLHRMKLPPDHPKHLTPRKKTLDKLQSFYHRYAYHALRGVGVPTHEASKFRFRSPYEVQKIMQDYRFMIRQIANAKGKPIEYITWGVGRTEMKKDQLEYYIKQKMYAPLELDEARKAEIEIAQFPTRVKSAAKKLAKRKKKTTKRKRK